MASLEHDPGAREAAMFYTATDEREAVEILRRTKVRYVIVDGSLPNDAGRFYELAWEDGRPVPLYHPDYYRTMASRLFSNEGKGQTPSNSSWAVATNARSEIVESHRFATWEEAASFIACDPSRWRLVGRDPMLSCVPIEPLSDFMAEFSSRSGVSVFRLTDH